MNVHTFLDRFFSLSLKSEVLALFFGVLIILATFGDERFRVSTFGSSIGNLDAIFGLRLWPVLDVLYPLATIAVFLLYGWSKQKRLTKNPSTILIFLSFLAALSLMVIDDVAEGVGFSIHLPHLYWIIISSVYPIYSCFAFVLFGIANEKKFDKTGY